MENHDNQTKKMKLTIAWVVLLLLLFVLSINGLIGGAMLAAVPDGSLLGMEHSWLDKTPFSDYLIPGIMLFIFNGLIPLAALIGLFYRRSIRFFGWFNIFPDKHWGWTWSVYSGIITITWIIVQQFLTQYFILQPIIASMGLLIVVFSLMPAVQNRY
jgi:hypothetical protein